MNDFERTLVAALRDEAEETSMSVDSHRAADELESRLDDADRSRHRIYWAAAAVVILVITGIAALTGSWPRQDASVPPAGPAPSPAASHVSYTSAIFVVPFSVSMPAWLSQHDVYNNGNFSNSFASPHEMSWSQSRCSPCADGYDLALRFVSPSGIYLPGDVKERPVPGYANYLVFLQAMESTYGLTITGTEQTTVGGQPATIMTLTPTQVVSGAAIACSKPDSRADDCWWPTVGVTLRLAVVDTGKTPLLIWIKANAANPAWPTIAQDFDEMLGTVRFAS